MHVESDWPASESLPLGAFVGECVVLALPVSFPVTRDIDADALAALLSAVCGDRPVTRVLLRTGYSLSGRVFPDDWPALTPHAAQWLLARGVCLWGTDAPSVDRRTSKDLPVHHALFAGGAFVLETLALDGVEPGVYELLAQPLAIEGADAAPVRALLRR
jgi:arylformamidase